MTLAEYDSSCRDPKRISSERNMPMNTEKSAFMSFLRRQESSHYKTFWMPDQVRHDGKGN